VQSRDAFHDNRPIHRTSRASRGTAFSLGSAGGNTLRYCALRCCLILPPRPP
jgi:hypothetical protein